MRDADITRKHKNLVYVQTLKLLQTTGRPKAPKRRVPDAKPVRGGRPRETALGEQELMQAGRAKGAAAGLVKEIAEPMPATDDEIREKYLERAIRELNQLTHELQDCPHCPRGKLMPVLGSGHPAGRHLHAQARADGGGDRGGRRLLRPRRQRADEKLQAARIDPLVVYGTLCVKCPIAEPDLAAEECVAPRGRGDRDRAAEDRRRHGRAGAARPQRPQVPLSRPIEPREGEIQAFTPTIDALYVPDIDDSLDEEDAKQRFWRAFKMLGDWYEDLPPY